MSNEIPYYRPNGRRRIGSSLKRQVVIMAVRRTSIDTQLPDWYTDWYAN